MSKVCIYCIAKNESAFVDRFMDSVRDADLVVIGDTGSTDDTVEKFRRRGAVVHQIEVKPWRFDVARNRVMDLVPPEYDCLFSIDIDETIETKDWKQKILAAWPGKTRLRYRYAWSLRPNGTPDRQFIYDKIHSRALRWVSPCHEILEGIDHGGMVDIDVYHRPDPAKSRGSYLGLLEMAAKERPQDSRTIHYYGRELFYHGNYLEATRVLEQHLTDRDAWSAERAESCRMLAESAIRLGRPEQAEQFYKKGIEICPGAREPLTNYAKWLQEQGRHQECCEYGLLALKITERQNHYLEDRRSWEEGPYDLVGTSAWWIGCWETSVEYSKAALQMAPGDTRLQDNYKTVLFNKPPNYQARYIEAPSQIENPNKVVISYWDDPWDDPVRARLHRQGVDSFCRFDPIVIPITRDQLKRSSRREFGLERDMPFFVELMDLAMEHAPDDSYLCGYVNSDCIWTKEIWAVLQSSRHDAVVVRHFGVAADTTTAEVDAGIFRELYTGHVGWEGFFFRPSAWKKLRAVLSSNLVIGESSYDWLVAILTKQEIKNHILVRGLIHPAHTRLWRSLEESKGTGAAQHNRRIMDSMKLDDINAVWFGHTVRTPGLQADSVPLPQPTYEPAFTPPLNIQATYFHANKLMDIADWVVESSYEAPGIRPELAAQIKLRGGIIHCRTYEVDELFELLRDSRNHYTLITHNSDWGIDRARYGRRPPCIRAWYSVNVLEELPGVIPLPIGIQRPNIGEFGDIEVLARQPRGARKFKNWAYLNVWIGTNQEIRGNAVQILRDKPFCTYRAPEARMGFGQYIDELVQHPFVISPPGRGLDCHRTWEALYCGVIPIVLQSPADREFKDLPILSVPSYDVLTEDFLKKAYSEIRSKTWNLDQLQADYWKNRILKHHGQLAQENLSVVSYYRDRHQMAIRTIPRWLELLGSHDELILVDYSDPAGTTDWVLGLADPRVKVVRVPGREFFNQSHARNVGIRQCSNAIVVQVDIDNIPNAELVAFCRGIKAGHYGAHEDGISHRSGFFATTRQEILEIRGAEEALPGAGGYDDSSIRTKLIARQMVRCTPPETEVIEHGDDERFRFTGGFVSEDIRHMNYANSQIVELLKPRGETQNNVGRDWGWGGVPVEVSLDSRSGSRLS